MDKFWEGDGRTLLAPKSEFILGGFPRPMRRAQAADLIDRFEKYGTTTHTAGLGVLWAVLAYCHVTETPYVLDMHPGVGATVVKGQV